MASAQQIWRQSQTYESATQRLQTQTLTLAGQGSAWVTSYTYDSGSAGRPRTVGYPSGLSVRRDYAANGELSQLSDEATGKVYWAGSAKDAWGNLTSETYLGSIVGTHASYASTGQLRQQQWMNGASLLDLPRSVPFALSARRIDLLPVSCLLPPDHADLRPPDP